MSTHFITKMLLVAAFLLQAASAINMTIYNPQYGVDYAFGSFHEQQTFLLTLNPFSILIPQRGRLLFQAKIFKLGLNICGSLCPN
jgi:hypothetical protein